MDTWERKKELAKVEKNAKIEARKTAGTKSLPQKIAEHPARLASYTPSSLKAELEVAGFDVKPLSGGKYRGIAFEDGGGYKVNFPDGGLLQYHPEKGSHHSGEYYKISTGKGGIKRYDRYGIEKPK